MKDLEKRVATASDVQDLQKRLAALEVRRAMQHAAATEPEKDESLAWPSNSARHLSQTQEKQDHEAFDDLSGYFHADNRTYKLYMQNAMASSCPREAFPGSSSEEREAQLLTCAAIAGQKDEAFAVLRKHPHLADLALAAAAFGDVAFTTTNEDESSIYFSITSEARARAKSNLGSRLEIVRHLFTQGHSGNSTFIDQGIDLVRKKKVDIDKRMIRLVSWGSLRRWLLVEPLKVSQSQGAFGLTRGFEIFLNYRKMADPLQHPTYSLVYPKAAMQYSMENPQVLEEKSSEGKTMLMEASLIRSTGDPDRPDPFHCLLAEAKVQQTPIDQMSTQGENAAMLAAQAGFSDNSGELEELKLEKEMEETSRVYHFQYMLLLVVGLHIAFAVMGLACHCGDTGDKQERTDHVLDFLLKIFILTGCNALIHYALVPGLLLRPHMLLQVSCNLSLPCSWPIFALLAAAFSAFMINDLRSAFAEAKKGVVGSQTVTAVNCYQDPKVPISHCMQTFLLSSIFVCVYYTAMSEPIEMTLFSRFFWACSLFVQYYISLNSFRPDSKPSFTTISRWALRLDDSQATNHDLWAALLRQDPLSEGEDASSRLRLSQAEVVLRFCMAYVSNGLYRIFIVYSLPVYLATSGTASDFALNAFAVTFISDLDNLSADVEYQRSSYESLEEPEQREMKLSLELGSQ